MKLSQLEKAIQSLTAERDAIDHAIAKLMQHQAPARKPRAAKPAKEPKL